LLVIAYNLRPLFKISRHEPRQKQYSAQN